MNQIESYSFYKFSVLGPNTCHCIDNMLWDNLIRLAMAAVALAGNGPLIMAISRLMFCMVLWAS